MCRIFAPTPPPPPPTPTHPTPTPHPPTPPPNFQHLDAFRPSFCLPNLTKVYHFIQILLGPILKLKRHTPTDFNPEWQRMPIWLANSEAEKKEFASVSPDGDGVFRIAKQLDHTNKDVVDEFDATYWY